MLVLLSTVIKEEPGSSYFPQWLRKNQARLTFHSDQGRIRLVLLSTVIKEEPGSIKEEPDSSYFPQWLRKNQARLTMIKEEPGSSLSND